MRRGWLMWGVIIGLIVLAGVWLGGGGGAVSSAMSRDSRGWLATQRYLAGRGTQVHLNDRPLTAGIETEVLVLAFPWQQAIADGETEALGEFLRRGGTVLLAYSGEIGRVREEQVLESLQLLTTEARSAPPLAPLSWWRYHNEIWSLKPTEEWTLPQRGASEISPRRGAIETSSQEEVDEPSPQKEASEPLWPALAISAIRGAPEAPRSARVLYRLPSGTPLVFEYPLHRGRVVVLPADVLANAWIAEAGNVDFLEWLRGSLTGEWSFDEYHHGLVAAETVAAESGSHFAWDLFILHLTLIYLLGLLALGRRFGPVWREAPVASGSAASFLRGLGALHRKMAHHREAGKLLIERARSYFPGVSFDDSIERRASEVAGDQDLVGLARSVARAIRAR